MTASVTLLISSRPTFDAVDLGQVRLDIARRQPAAVQRQDLVVKPLKPPLALADDLRLKRSRRDPAARRSRPGPCSVISVLGLRPVARVARPARRLGVRLIAQMVSQLDLHRALHQPLGQLRQQPARPGDLLLRRRAGQQLIDHLIGDPLAIGPRDHPPQSGAVHGVIHPRLTEPRIVSEPSTAAPSARLAARRRRHTDQETAPLIDLLFLLLKA